MKKVRAGPCLESSFSGIQSWVPVVVWVEARVRAGQDGAGLGWCRQLDSNGVLCTDSNFNWEAG